MRADPSSEHGRPTRRGGLRATPPQGLCRYNFPVPAHVSPALSAKPTGRGWDARADRPWLPGRPRGAHRRQGAACCLSPGAGPPGTLWWRSGRRPGLPCWLCGTLARPALAGLGQHSRQWNWVGGSQGPSQGSWALDLKTERPREEQPSSHTHLGPGPLPPLRGRAEEAR